jgi:hypothetical protein
MKEIQLKWLVERMKRLDKKVDRALEMLKELQYEKETNPNIQTYHEAYEDDVCGTFMGKAIALYRKPRDG